MLYIIIAIVVAAGLAGYFFWFRNKGGEIATTEPVEEMTTEESPVEESFEETTTETSETPSDGETPVEGTSEETQDENL